MTHAASPLLRLLAALIDFLIGLLLVLFTILNLSTFIDLPGLLTSVLNFFVVAFLASSLLSLFYTWLTSWLGGSPGKLLCGLAVVDSQGRRISFRRAFFRNQIGYLVSGLFFWLGFIWILVDSDRRAWHDQFADTHVAVVSPSLFILGLIGGLLLVGANLVVIPQIYTLQSSKLSLYRQVFTEFKSELSPSPTPEPTLIPPQKFTTKDGRVSFTLPGKWPVQEFPISSTTSGVQKLLFLGSQVQIGVQTNWQGRIKTDNLPAIESNQMTTLESQNPGMSFTEASPPQLISISGYPSVRIDLFYTPKGTTLTRRRISIITDTGKRYYLLIADFSPTDTEIKTQLDDFLATLTFF